LELICFHSFFLFRYGCVVFGGEWHLPNETEAALAGDELEESHRGSCRRLTDGAEVEFCRCGAGRWLLPGCSPRLQFSRAGGGQSDRMISLLAMGFKDYARGVPRCFLRLNRDAEEVARK
jgi:hypothetical protein